MCQEIRQQMEKITGGTRVTSLGKEAVMGQGGLQSCGLWRGEDAPVCGLGEPHRPASGGTAGS